MPGGASVVSMEKRVEPAGAVGCLVAAVAAVVGFVVWIRGAGPGLSGGFEGQRDWSLLYVELPLMLFGVPALTVAAWAVTGTTLHSRSARATRTAASITVAATTLALLAWAGLTWLDIRVEPFVHPTW